MTSNKIKWFVLGFFLLTPSLVFPAEKIDPMFSMITQKGATLDVARRRGLLKSVSALEEPVVKTLVRFEGDLSGVEALGGKVQSILGDVATVEVPLSAIEPISQLSNIVYIEAPKKVRPLLNASVPATGANFLRTGTPPNWTGSTGRGVVVGIVDSGIDLNHLDFKDASGKSRILFLQYKAQRFGLSISTECTGALIDSGGCSEFDSLGHGTHVAGIAAGDGSATGNGRAAYRYIGMAPEADLIIVNALTADATSADVLNGIAYVQQKAAALGKPSVINLSLGSDLGPHDGTSDYERFLDNASGPGRIIVSAAGNEAQAAIHASGNVDPNVPKTVFFNIPSNSSEEVLDIWYPGADPMGVSFSIGNCITPVISPGTFQTLCNGALQVVSTNINPQNGDREIQVIIGASGNGSFTLSLPIDAAASRRFDAWFEFGGDISDNVKFTSTSEIDPSITLVDSATATRAIAVGAFVTKNSWTSQLGQQNDFTLSVSNIAPFSSHGPRRLCSALSQCPSVQKPEIAAPGAVIMSALSRNAAAFPTLGDPDGVHTVLEGTSMSTPHVTGAVALLLQADPTLTPEEIKTIFSATASRDGFTGTTPNNTWGYGKLNVFSSFAATPNSVPSPPTGLTATPSAGSVRLSWTASPELDIDGYNLYRSQDPDTGFLKVASIAHTGSSFTNTGLQEVPYYFVLRSVDTAGQESVNSPEVSATPGTPPPGGGGGGGCVLGLGGEGDLVLGAILAWTLISLVWRVRGKRHPGSGAFWPR